MTQRDTWLSLTDTQLLAQCDVDTYRASGPGGQKRNKTSSAVRLRHLPSGLIVIAEESRSQHENKAKALRRLRHAFVLKLRDAIDTVTVGTSSAIAAVRDGDGRLHVPSSRNENYWPAVAVILDVVEAKSAHIREAAELLGVTTANLLSFLELDAKVWEQVNIARRAFGHKPLRAD